MLNRPVQESVSEGDLLVAVKDVWGVIPGQNVLRMVPRDAYLMIVNDSRFDIHASMWRVIALTPVGVCEFSRDMIHSEQWFRRA